MAITSGTKINFYNTDLSTFTSQQENVKDGSLFFINDGNGHGGRIYSGSNLVANVGFEEFSVTKSGNGSYITGITPTSSVSDDGTLTLGLTLSTGTPAAAQNNYATVNIAAASTVVTNRAGLSSAVTVGPNTTSDTLTFTPGNKWITLYGSANGDSITVSHLVGTISGGTAGTVYGPTVAVTQTAGSSAEIMVPQLKVDEAGHVTQVNHYKLTVVDTANTDRAKAYFGALSSNDVSLHIGPAATASTDGTNGRGVTFSQGTDIAFTRNNDAKLTINHATITPSVTIVTDTETVKPGQSKTITWLDNFGLGSNGHVSGYSKKTLNIDLTGLTDAIHWKGSVASLPSRPSSGWVDYATGDVIAVGGKEYILDNDTSTGTTGWREFGDEGNWVPKTRKVLGDGTYLTHSGTGALSSDVTISHKALLGTGGTPDTSYGTNTKVPQIKVDAAGHVTSIQTVDINFPEAVEQVYYNNNTSATGQLTIANGAIPASGGEITINAGNKWIRLAGEQAESANIIKIAHDAPGGTPVTTVGGEGIGATTTDGQTSWTFEVITDVSTDNAKHVTYIERKPLSIYSNNSDHAYLYLGKAKNPTSTLANGWTSNNTGAFINVKSTQDTTSDVGDDHNIKIIGAKDVSVDVTAKGVITVQHSNAAITANTTDGFKTFAVDAYGHVTSYTAKTATTFTVKADNTSVATQTDFGTAQTLNFAKPSTSAADATKLKISGSGSSIGVTYDFGPVWQTL